MKLKWSGMCPSVCSDQTGPDQRLDRIGPKRKIRFFISIVSSFFDHLNHPEFGYAPKDNINLLS